MNLSYLKTLGLHVLLGVFMYFFRSFGSIYLILIIAFFFRKALLVAPNKRALVFLYACAYITGVEVLFRMTGVAIFYEASKYTVILFSVAGIVYKGFHKRALIYIFGLILLVPSIYITLYEFDFGLNIRKAIAFNLSGPFCLGIASVFIYGIAIKKEEMLKLFNYILYPLVSILVYLFVFNPDVSSIITGTGSNYETSGGFGPNQVATVLGMGMFICTVKYFYFSTTRVSKILDLLLLALFSFRGVVTFSRGGIFTAVVMILVFLLFMFFSSSRKQKSKVIFSIIGFLTVVAITWGISSIQTNGFIEKRYANENARGVKKSDVTTGRSELFEFELNQFIENPLFGIGVGRVKQVRFEATGRHAVASHNEMSRIIAEHGLFGVLCFIILLLMPLVFHLRNKKNIFFYPFYLFWFLTINHSSMRIAAPAFIYALSLLHYTNEKPAVHREQVIEQE